MRVLIISHSVLNETTNMGKTLFAQFANWDTHDIAQLYLHSGVPHLRVCTSYYCFSDIDALKSILIPNHHGHIYDEEDIPNSKGNTESALLSFIYTNARRRKLQTYVMRDVIWNCCHWRNRHLSAWLQRFAPDIVYLVPGDYAFTYDIGYRIAKDLQIPMMVSCMDDYFIQNTFGNSKWGKLWKKYFMKKVYRAMEYASEIQTICESMGEKYRELFHTPCFALYSSAEQKAVNLKKQQKQISYIGNIALGRAEQLCDIGKALKQLDIPGIPKYIDVYSGEKRPELLKMMTRENGINFHGAIPQNEILDIFQKSIAVIHTESFCERFRERVRYSVSTKIAESLSYGPCMIAYGPADIASMSYLSKTGAAYVITEEKQLHSGLIDILSNDTKRTEVQLHARKAAAQNHNIEQNMRILQQHLQAVVDKETT